MIRSLRKGKGVIHIGFLSSTKILSLDRKFHASAKSRFGLVVSARVLPGDIHLSNRSGRPALLCTCEFSLVSFVESAWCQAALSRSHPSGSRPGTMVPAAPRARPHPDTVGTRTTSVPYPVQSMSIPQDGRDRPNELPHPTRHSTLRDSGHGRKRIHRSESRFVYVQNRCGGRPIRL
jgi:hypothetical protein